MLFDISRTFFGGSVKHLFFLQCAAYHKDKNGCLSLGIFFLPSSPMTAAKGKTDDLWSFRK
jgi:hypothetical protein